MVQLAAVAGARTLVAAFPAAHGILIQDLASLVQLPRDSVACLVATAATTTTPCAPTDSLGLQQQEAADTQSATTGHVDGADEDDPMVSGRVVIRDTIYTHSARTSHVDGAAEDDTLVSGRAVIHATTHSLSFPASA